MADASVPAQGPSAHHLRGPLWILIVGVIAYTITGYYPKIPTGFAVAGVLLVLLVTSGWLRRYGYFIGMVGLAGYLCYQSLPEIGFQKPFQNVKVNWPSQQQVMQALPTFGQGEQQQPQAEQNGNVQPATSTTASSTTPVTAPPTNPNPPAAVLPLRILAAREPVKAKLDDATLAVIKQEESLRAWFCYGAWLESLKLTPQLDEWEYLRYHRPYAQVPSTVTEQQRLAKRDAMLRHGHLEVNPEEPMFLRFTNEELGRPLLQKLEDIWYAPQ